MVGRTLSRDGQRAPAADGAGDPWGDEPSESVWHDVAPRRGLGAARGHGGRRQDAAAAPRPGQGLLDLADDDDNVWDEARKQTNSTVEHVPHALQPGGSRAETNPFLRRKPVPQGRHAPPVESLSEMNLGEASQDNPWHTAIEAQRAPSDRPPPPPPPPQPSHLLSDDVESDPWPSSGPQAPPSQQPPVAASPALMSLPEEEDAAWNDEARAANAEVLLEPRPDTAMSQELIEDQHVWDDLGSLDKGKAKAAALDDWNLVDADSSSSPAEKPAPGDSPDSAASAAEDEKPPLPRRTDGARPRWVPSRQPVDGKSETYQVKNIRWHDHQATSNPRTSPILMQNKNGPCPLVALVNALTLTTPANMADTALVQVLRSREQVSLNLLLDAVFDELMSPRRTTSDDSLPDVSDLYAFLQSLHTGMNVNPRFVPAPDVAAAYQRSSLAHLPPGERGGLVPGTFEDTVEMSLYSTFSVPLIHGWLPPPSDPAYEALERQAASYEEVQNLLFREEELEDKLSDPSGGLTDAEQHMYQDIVTIKMFLGASATQLTPWGIEVISKAMRPGTLAILFRNDHFSTLYRHPHTTQLLSLVTDAGFGSHDEVVWESLADVNGERTEYLSGDFRVVGGGSMGGVGAHQGGGEGGEWTTVASGRGKGRQQGEEPLSPRHEQEDRDLALALQLQEEEERHREEQARRRRESILSEQYIEQQAQRPGPVNRGVRRNYAGAGSAVAGSAVAGSAVAGSAIAGSATEPRRSTSVGVAATAGQPPRQSSENPQQIRPLVPPRRQGVTRRAESSAEDAPPSYEQAAQDPAFVPPAGHPSHAASSPIHAASSPAPQPRPGSRMSGGNGHGPGPRVQRPPGPPGGRRLPVSPGAAMGSTSGSGPGRERECAVM